MNANVSTKLGPATGANASTGANVSAWRALFRRPNAMVGGVLLAIMLAAALIGHFYTPYDPVANDLTVRLMPPTAEHWLGTDEWGRDVFSRLLFGAGVSMTISFVTVVCAVTAGALIGAATGFFGGWFERVVMAWMDALLAFPSLIMALGVMTVFGSSRYGVVLALSLAYLPSVVRIVRSSVLSLREKEYVEASRVMGNSELYTMFRHILPNCVAPIIVLATALFGWALLSESALSFLGLGVPPPASSWGGMLSDSRNFFGQAPWLALAPGLSISISLLGINLFGDALRDQFDPRMKNL
ncbi:ABC transporter permease [Noviherbaspirillum saxi]|uniref:ABC transporter permease n=1 Tax=Noviherbaspirillum saxi TaxID=2320863 RepID=A0A3A3FMJ2_9BURK|nr:ABC transporter permease [Noviherbaspirillum saxi]RJF97437.1 ABC transporter permease [Noviherbaspirillum saxi]